MPDSLQNLLDDALHASPQRFPIIERIEPVLEAIEGRREFCVHNYGGFRILDYHNEAATTFPPLQDPPHAPHALRRECRGLIFDPQGTLVCRKFHKFFSIGQRHESTLDAIDWTRPFQVLEKLDGTLVAPLRWHQEIVWTTRGGPSPIAQQAADWAAAHPGIETLVNALLTAGWTPLFEWCSRQHLIVLDHPQSRLVLTAIRHQRSGTYLPFPALQALASAHECPIVQAYGQVHSLAEAAVLVENTAQEHEGEGYILQAEDGRLFKVKSQMYNQLHQLLANGRPDKYGWQMALQGEITRLHSKLPPEQAATLVGLQDALKAAIVATAAQMQSFVREARESIEADHPTLAPHEHKRIFAKEWKPRWPGAPQVASALFRVWEGEDPEAYLRTSLLRKLQSESGIQDTRRWLGLGPRTMLSLSPPPPPRRTSAPKHRTLIIGDVHGCLDELQALLRDVSYNGSRYDDHLVFVGDLIDHGPASAEVVDFVCQELRGGARLTLVQGNHEAKLLESWHRHCFQTRNIIPEDPHEAPTLAAWVHDLTEENWSLLTDAKLFCALPEHEALVVHAGIPSSRHSLPFCATASMMARNQQRAASALQFLRYERQSGKQVRGVRAGQEQTGDWYWAQRYDGHLGHVYYGHHPYLQAQPQVWPHATGLDLGCVIGGALAAAILHPGASQAEFVTQSAHKLHTQPHRVEEWADIRLGLLPMPTLPSQDPL